MKDLEEFDVYLDSDAQQTISYLREKILMATMALRDIHIWAEDLSQAKNIASYALDKIGKLDNISVVKNSE